MLRTLAAQPVCTGTSYLGGTRSAQLCARVADKISWIRPPVGAFLPDGVLGTTEWGTAGLWSSQTRPLEAEFYVMARVKFILVRGPGNPLVVLVRTVREDQPLRVVLMVPGGRQSKGSILHISYLRHPGGVGGVSGYTH